VKTSDGKPVAGAQVRLATPQVHVSVYDNRSLDAGSAKTGVDGSFTIEAPEGPCYLVVSGERGYAQVTREQLTKSAEIVVQAWGKVEGIVKIGSRPAAGVLVTLTRIGQWLDPYSMLVNHEQTLTADAQGRYVFERVAPGNAWVCRRTHPPYNLHEAIQYVEVEAGKTMATSLGGVGRPVIGRLALPEGADEKVQWRIDRTNSFSAALMKGPVPLLGPGISKTNLSFEERRLAFEKWDGSEAGRDYRLNGYGISFWVEPDGSFRIEDVPSGIHRLSVQAMRDETGSFTEMVAELSLPVEVKAVEGGQSDEPLDLGTVVMEVPPRLRLGKPAPALLVRGLDGAEVKLSDYAGKFVLLMIWSKDRRPKDDDIWFIKLANEQNAKNGKLTVLTVEMTGDVEAAKRLVLESGLDQVGKHAVGQFSRGALRDKFSSVPIIPREYLATPNLIALIDPEGKVVAKNLRGSKIELAVYQAMFAR
jgi:hypothetical protein